MRLNKETREIIDQELKESEGEIRRLKQESKEKREKENKIKIEEYIKHKALDKYPERYRRIIDQIKRENILLYEYYLDEYPPDWDYRANVVKERDKNACQKCGSNTDLCVHHKIPVKKTDFVILDRYAFTEKRIERTRLMKSDHFLDNLITLCKNCHLKEHPSILRKINDNTITEEVCEKCGKQMVIRWSKKGKFIGCSGFPDCKNIKSIEEPSPNCIFP